MQRTLIIAEAGVNHNGSIQLAKELIDTAAESGADIVKFQSFKADKLVSKAARKATYQVKNTGNDESQYNMLKKLELSYDHHVELVEYCIAKKIQFLSTPFDKESVELLKRLGIQIGKIPSGEITNLPYLQQMAANFNEIILSTGMSSMNEIEDAITILTANSPITKDSITVLHCNTEYPTPFEDVNLMAMQTIGSALKVKIGYSDHTNGIEVPIAAVALGASIIEKHFTLSRNMEGPDHKASLEPNELRQMVSCIRNIEESLGSSVKKPSESESKNIIIARKSIVAGKSIKKGEQFSEDNLTVKRPGSGISPMRWYEVLQYNAIRDFEEDELIVL